MSKRIKFDPKESFATGLLESVEELKSLYDNSKPYYHLRIPTLFQDELLRNVRKEIKELAFTEKETDIYKVNQTGDLANLDGLGGDELDKLTSLFRLRNSIYSEEFRGFIQSITGCGKLSGKNIDLSINKYSQGCHLLNHDDVIGTRVISFIIYLPDPEDEWKPEYGGGLELYPVKVKGTPEDEPSLTLEPTWNSFAMFEVQPGHSFHSVEEVVANKERISISGWFHLPVEGEDGYDPDTLAKSTSENSTLEQILAGEFSGFEDIEETELESDLSEEEILYLADYLNASYITPQSIEQMNSRFVEDSYIVLSKVLKDEVQEQVEKAIAEADAGFGNGVMSKHGSGVGNGWSCFGPPHLHRYLTVTDSSEGKAPTASILGGIANFFSSLAFKKWLYMVSSLSLKSSRSVARRFRPGLDYSLALANPEPVIHVNLCLTKEHAKWESGEVGGYASYMTPHDELDAAVYKSTPANDDDVLLTLPANWNSLSITLRDKGVLYFVKYTSALAPGSRWDIDAEYCFHQVEEEEEVQK